MELVVGQTVWLEELSGGRLRALEVEKVGRKYVTFKNCHWKSAIGSSTIKSTAYGVMGNLYESVESYDVYVDRRERRKSAVAELANVHWYSQSLETLEKTLKTFKGE